LHRGGGIGSIAAPGTASSGARKYGALGSTSIAYVLRDRVARDELLDRERYCLSGARRLLRRLGPGAAGVQVVSVVARACPHRDSRADRSCAKSRRKQCPSARAQAYAVRFCGRTGSFRTEHADPARYGWDLISASGINDRGEIVGFGTYEGGHMALFWPRTAPQ